MSTDKLSSIAKNYVKTQKVFWLLMKVPIRLKKDLILLMSNQTLRNEETTGIFYLKLQI